MPFADAFTLQHNSAINERVAVNMVVYIVIMLQEPLRNGKLVFVVNVNDFESISITIDIAMKHQELHHFEIATQAVVMHTFCSAALWAIKTEPSHFSPHSPPRSSVHSIRGAPLLLMASQILNEIEVIISNRLIQGGGSTAFRPMFMQEFHHLQLPSIRGRIHGSISAAF